MIPMLAMDGDEAKMVLVVGACAVAIVWIVAGAVRQTMSRRYREESRREIAAYVAEGTIAPQDAVALLAAGDDDVRKTIADGVAWGTIKPRDAEALIGASARVGGPTPAA